MSQPQFLHFRVSQSATPGGNYHPFGGMTAGFVYDELNSMLVVGVARCSMKDRYSKSIGRKLVKERILAQREKALDSRMEESFYECFTISYSTILQHVHDSLSDVLRPDAYEATIRSVQKLEHLSGSFINNYVSASVMGMIQKHERQFQQLPFTMDEMDVPDEELVEVKLGLAGAEYSGSEPLVH